MEKNNFEMNPLHLETANVVKQAFNDNYEINIKLDEMFQEISKRVNELNERQLFSDIINVYNGKWRTYEDYKKYKINNYDPQFDCMAYSVGLKSVSCLSANQFNYILYLKYTNNKER